MLVNGDENLQYQNREKTITFYNQVIKIIERTILGVDKGKN